jgi:c-di-GMP-binding flagellar brake protein YcgR
MSDDRRNYYRIEDCVHIQYRVIPTDAREDERRFVFLHELKASNVQAALGGIDIRLHEVLEAVRHESKLAAEAIDLLNRKITLIERVVASLNSPDTALDQREREPVTVSISGGGVSLESAAPVALQVSLAIDLVLLPSNHPMRIIGRVVGCRATDSGRHALAIEFEEMRDADRDFLVQHILRKQSSVLRSERGDDNEHAA